MSIGVVILMTKGGEEIDKKFSELAKMGFDCCQLNCWSSKLMTKENAELVKEASKKYNVDVAAFWCGCSGSYVWNFTDGPHTIGIVPAAYRQNRMAELRIGADFAEMMGVKDVVTHLGFIPEVPTSTEYHEIVCAVRSLATYMKRKEQRFLFETGQETPVTLRRLIEDVGTGNVGINLDPANLILYGKANPVDALDVFGEYVYNTHMKDGLYPANGQDLGQEVILGEGKVNFPSLIGKLKEIGYKGPYIIEREVSGDDWYEGVRHAHDFLKKLI